MAKQPQSEPSLGLDRRQLLASAAALSLGNIPVIEAPEASKAVTVAKVPTSKTTTWPVCAFTARKIGKIVQRNRIRQEAGLPLLSIPKELRRMKHAADAREFEDFADRHRQA